MKCCPTCKRPFPPEVQLSGKRRQLLYDYVARHPAGVTTAQIMDYVWNDDPNGGPNSSDIVSSMVYQINDEFSRRDFGFRLAGSGGRGSLYKLYPIGSKELHLGRISKRIDHEIVEAVSKDPRSLRELAGIHGISPASVQRIKQKARNPGHSP